MVELTWRRVAQSYELTSLEPVIQDWINSEQAFPYSSNRVNPRLP